MKALQRIQLVILFTALLVSTNSFAQTWNFQFSDSAGFNQIVFPDQNTGYILGDNGTAYKSTNQGQTWNLLNLGVNSFDYRLEKSYFFDANNGFVVGRHNSFNAVVVKTTDGGVTWSANTNFADRLNGISFSNTMSGITVGKNGIWYKTTDAGNTWLIQTNFTSEDINDIYFLNSSTAICVCDGGSLYKSVDSGLTWSLISLSTAEDLTSIYFLNANNGFVTATNGVLLETQNGGSSWSTLNTGVNYDLEDVYFLNSSNGYVVGLSTDVLHTTDGGNTWSATSTTAQSDIKTIYMLSGNLGYFATHDGEVFVHNMTTDIEFTREEKFSAKIMPNPVNDHAVLKIFDQINNSWNVELFDILGNRILGYSDLEENTISINGNALKSGIYFYKVANIKNQTYTGLFTVN